MMNLRFPARYALFLAALVLSPATASSAQDVAPLAFEITYTPDVHPGPVTARVYVMLGPAGSPVPPRRGLDWMNPQPFFAVEAKDWKPGEPLRIGPDAIGFPAPLDKLPPGEYAAQAVIRLNPDTHRIGDGEGNAYGPVVRAQLDPAKGSAVPLVADTVIKPRPFRESERLKLVEIPSPLLTAFHGRPMRQRAALVLPEGLKPGEKRPTVYIIPGFGGDHRSAYAIERGGGGPAPFGRDLIRVVLDPDCGTGHHVFADSATNGPRGESLVKELIPHIEANFPAIAEPSARLLTGHSSGGWSSLWLQVTYPDFFGGTWSTSPDPVDFRDFQRIDLYAPDVNMYRDPEGNRRPIARRGTEPVLWYDDFSRMEQVIGPGGQLGSFEAVFSPRLPDGHPRPLWDRETGAVDPETARAWQAYDIRLVLERNWGRLGPKLAGKLHIYTGELDTFYLEGAVALLARTLNELGSDAAVEIYPGKDHSSVFSRELIERIEREMQQTLARHGHITPEARAPAEAAAR